MFGKGYFGNGHFGSSYFGPTVSVSGGKPYYPKTKYNSNLDVIEIDDETNNFESDEKEAIISVGTEIVTTETVPTEFEYETAKEEIEDKFKLDDDIALMMAIYEATS